MNRLFLKKKGFDFVIIIFITFFSSTIISYFLAFNYFNNKKLISIEDEAKNIEKIKGLNNIQDSNIYSTSSNTQDLINRLQSLGKTKEEIDEYLKDLKPHPVVILGYHQIREFKETDGPKTKLFITTPETFEKEMKYLYENGYTSITPSEYIKYLNSTSTNPIPEKSVVITFDDGYASQYQNAFPVLKKYDFVATFFVYKSCIDEFPACMTISNLKELVNSKNFIANHTSDHVLLTKYTPEYIKKEIDDNQKWLFDNFATSSIENVLAYPYGGENKIVRDITRDLGYLGAIGITQGVEKDNSNIYNLNRYLLGDNYQRFLDIFSIKN